MTLRHALLAASAVAASALFAAPATAESCVGTTGTVSVCLSPDVYVDPDGGPGYDDCVQLGGPSGSCTPVHVSTPGVGTGGGSLVSVSCGACDGAPDPETIEQVAELVSRLYERLTCPPLC